MAVGFKKGIVFTVFSAVCVVAVCLAVFLFIIALISVFFQVLITVAAVAVGFFLMTNGMSNGSSVVDALAKDQTSKQVFYDNDGHVHYNSGARDTANRNIAERKNSGNA